MDVNERVAACASFECHCARHLAHFDDRAPAHASSTPSEHPTGIANQRNLIFDTVSNVCFNAVIDRLRREDCETLGLGTGGAMLTISLRGGFDA